VSARDIVNHPSHYNGHPSRVECADLILATNSLLGLAIKHVWRCGEKHDATCPIYAHDLHDRLSRARVGDSISAAVSAAFESNLPCPHCAAIDRRKAAWYLRRLSKWLVDEHCHAVPYGLHATLTMAKSIFNATPEKHPLRVVLRAAWGADCEGIESDSLTWNADYSERCVRAAEALENPEGWS
jgi:hypothetical protein